MTTGARYAAGSTSAIPGLPATRMSPFRWLTIYGITPSILAVGRRSDRVWHFWSPSARAALPVGKLEGCTVQARVLISPGALLQMGMDYWRSPTIPYGSGGNNHEAGASHWYFPSPQWQEATFTDIGGPQF